jgi:hypothetical protein
MRSNGIVAGFGDHLQTDAGARVLANNRDSHPLSVCGVGERKNIKSCLLRALHGRLTEVIANCRRELPPPNDANRRRERRMVAPNGE